MKYLKKGSTLIINNYLLNKIPEWHEESGVEWFVKQLPRRYAVDLHDDTIPGVAVVSPKARNTYFKKGSLLRKLFDSSLAKKYRTALLYPAFIRLKVAKYSGLIRKSDYFCASYYLENNPDVAKAQIDPVSHYLLNGGFEGRNPSKNFDSAFYLAQNPDVKDARINPLVHYLRFGKKENRKPTPK